MQSLNKEKLEKPFWETKTLQEMTQKEWESLCDGCGKCCLIKLEDASTKELFYTDVSCHLLDARTCQCKDYKHRRKLVDDCLQIGTAAGYQCTDFQCFVHFTVSLFSSAICHWPLVAASWWVTI